MCLSLAFIKSNLQCQNTSDLKNVKYETYNSEYESVYFQINDTTFRSRLAKKTPNKKGYFVVFWTKDENNKNRPFTYEECADKLIISIIDGQRKGLFIFPKSTLKARKLLQTEHSKGKMAIRVYPTWETELNQTAKKSQKWQTDYFVDLSRETDHQLFNQLLEK
ncbi:MepB family protein [Staphylococcus caeli]|uniref:MepB family protein n=1 Tax=Staphylococcus caeli TaxID=2201815 RepID=UPI003F57265F